MVRVRKSRLPISLFALELTSIETPVEVHKQVVARTHAVVVAVDLHLCPAFRGKDNLSSVQLPDVVAVLT